ncbi:MAG: D-alanyl-D-alanine carboxypeptidase family protein, partial [Clostridium sp.]
MKRIISLILSAMMVVFGPAMTALAKPAWPSDTGIQSEAGIVMDMNSRAVLFGQNIHVQKAPASITKLLTALVVVENSNMSDMVTISHDAVYDIESGSGNKLSLEEGDSLSVEDSLYILLLQSSNQIANALAEHVAGSKDAFVELMNKKVQELGCEDSHFANPSGLNDDTQLTSAYDMALIGIAAYDNPKLLEINSAKSHKIPVTKNNPNGASFAMEHKLLTTTNPESSTYYPDAIAGKTGYTSVAGQTLVTYAKRDEKRLIAVTLKSTSVTHYKDTIALLNF